MADTAFKVLRVLSPMELVVNAGSDHGVSVGDSFVIYQLDDEIIDPESGENLGRLERLRGTGVATHVQAKLTTVRSQEKKTESRLRERMSGSATRLLGLGFDAREPYVYEVSVDAPFVNPAVGDLARKL